MTTAFFYNTAYKILESIYTNTYTEKRFLEIVQEEKQKNEENEILSKTTFFYNTLKNFPWYTILYLIEKFREEMNKKSEIALLNAHKTLLIALIEDIDFELKERLKTIFYQNIEIVFKHYYSQNEKMSVEEVTYYLSQTFSNIEYLVSLELAENTEYENAQYSFIKTQNKKDSEIRDNISKENFNKKDNILNSTINILKNHLDDNGLKAFSNLIKKSLENIANSYSSTFPINMDFYTKLLEKIKASVVRRRLNALKKQNELPLVKMFQK